MRLQSSKVPNLSILENLPIIIMVLYNEFPQSVHFTVFASGSCFTTCKNQPSEDQMVGFFNIMLSLS